MRVGIITAMAEETKPLIEKLGVVKNRGVFSGAEVLLFDVGGHDVYLAKSGVGELRAAITTQALIDLFDVDVVLNFGFVGSLDGRLHVGELVFVGAVVHYQYDTSAVDGNAVGQYGGRDGVPFFADESIIDRIQRLVDKPLPIVTCASGDKFVASKEDKDFLKSLGANICDMECAGISMACERNQKPFVSVKAVSDEADGNAMTSFDNVVQCGVTNYEHLLPHVLSGIFGMTDVAMPPSVNRRV